MRTKLIELADLKEYLKSYFKHSFLIIVLKGTKGFINERLKKSVRKSASAYIFLSWL